MRQVTAILLLLLPTAFGAWQLYVEPSFTDVSIYGYADVKSCATVVSGSVSEVQYVVGEDVETVVQPGDYICVPADTIFILRLPGPAILSFPDSDVSSARSFFYSISWRDIGSRTILEIKYSQLPIVLLMIIAVLVIFGLFFYVRRRRAVFGDYESSILDYIAKNPGCTQKDIAAALGLQKYQVSRILSRLEQRGIIIRVRRGISKRVYLKEQLQ